MVVIKYKKVNKLDMLLYYGVKKILEISRNCFMIRFFMIVICLIIFLSFLS